MPENQAAHVPREKSSWAERFNLRAGVFHHAAVAHSGRTSRLAPTARQAKADMFHVGIRNRRAVGNLHHLVDATARGIHFQTQFAIGGAGIQTKSAMYA